MDSSEENAAADAATKAPIVLRRLGFADPLRWIGKGWRDFIRWHGALARKRREIRANRKGSAAENIYRGSVVLRYLFGRRTFGGMMR